MQNIKSIIWGLAAFLCIGVGLAWGASWITYTQNTNPLLTDELMGIDDPGGSWGVNRFTVEGVIIKTYTDSTYGLLDEDAMGTDSAIRGATQQSIKAYVDNNVSGQFEAVPTNAETTKGPNSDWAYDHVNNADEHTQYLKEADLETSPTNGETAKAPNSDWAYDHENGADPHPLYQLEANVTLEDTGAYSLSDGAHKIVTLLDFTAGESIDDGVPVYIKYDGVTDNRTELYEYTGDTTDTDNDTYCIIGFATESGTTGDTITVFVGLNMFTRRDEFSAYDQTTIGKPLFTAGTAGAMTITPQATTGDHNEMVGVFIAASGYDSVTGYYVLQRVPNYTNVVP